MIYSVIFISLSANWFAETAVIMEQRDFNRNAEILVLEHFFIENMRFVKGYSLNLEMWWTVISVIVYIYWAHPEAIFILHKIWGKIETYKERKNILHLLGMLQGLILSKWTKLIAIIHRVIISNLRQGISCAEITFR